MPYTTEEYIDIAKVSTYLARKDVASGVMYGQRLYPNLPQTLAMETNSIEWIYQYSPSEPTLFETGSYLYSLCGKYALAAVSIIAGGGGGSVIVPISPDGYEYKVINDTILSDASTYFNSLLVGGRDMIIILNEQPLTEGVGFTYDSPSGVVTFITYTLFAGDKISLSFNKKI